MARSEVNCGMVFSGGVSLERVLIAALGLLLACGRMSDDDPPGNITSTGGAPIDASGDAAGEGSSVATGGALDISSGGSTAAKPTCSPRTFGFDPSSAETTVSSGITVEPLQLPMFDDAVGIYRGPMNPDPSTWDRSALPQGACVYRLHGINADCYPEGGAIYAARCGELSADVVQPFSFYEVNHCRDIAPGCPSAAIATGAPGAWWYLSRVSDTVADLVICAPECGTAFTQTEACLMLDPNWGTCG